MKKRLEEIREIVNTQKGGRPVYSLNVSDMEWLVEQAEIVRQVEAILACSDLNQEEQFNNINAIFYNE